MTKSVIRVIKSCTSYLHAFSAGSFLLFVMNVCDARGDGNTFSPSTDPSVQNLAAAILSEDLAAVKRNAADQFDVQQKKELKAFVLNYGTGEVVRFLNSHAQLGIEDLQISVIESHLEAIKRLVPKRKHRPSFAVGIDAHTPLRLAVRRGKVSVVKLLLDQNVPANEYLQMFQPGNGFSVLSEAIRQGNTEIIQLLIIADVAIEDDSSTFVPIENAIYKGKPVAEILKSYQTRFFA